MKVRIKYTKLTMIFSKETLEEEKKTNKKAQ